ncbi:efflux RND transporter periplasmic adaptor subunit [Arenimonas terrae]|uniref:Efflux RND transporter periplasmic adaptor subunit n=1 Tax=Arenimonas terrae TaxID=2546226 RepID=A0A5C4RUV4_9GAMM|nr:efflux RND transporter periplasmic adaptor subunit [Arenimonas terrae]TNJ35006.1 efflux RND transporter periplasmic adaptor subunit [Arenimonas terrae]
MKPNKKILAGVLIAAVIGLPLLIKATRGESSKEVDIVAAAEQEIRPTILASGVLAYLNEVNLTSELVAKVREILVKEGDTVVQGQLLLTLDPETYRNAIDREEASRRQSAISIDRQRLSLALAEKRLARGAQLIERKMIGQSEFDDLRNARDLARVELQSSEEALRRADAILGEAREQLGKTDIRAPIAGTIVDLPIKVGETAIPSTNALAGASLMKIADTSAIQAELKVDEADIARVTIGQSVDVYATAFPETALKGKVQRIALAPTLENQARTYEVVVLMEAPEGVALRSGMSARADIFLGDGERRLAVPVEAVGTEENEDKKTERFVWVDRDGAARRIVVQVGQSDDRWEEITGGLKIGDRVITGPAKLLRGLVEGDRVSERVVADKPKAADGESGASGDEATE